MSSGKNVKLKVTYERGTTWITVKGEAWKRKGLPEKYIDGFGDVWLKPWFTNNQMYVTVLEPKLFFIDFGGYLEDV